MVVSGVGGFHVLGRQDVYLCTSDWLLRGDVMVVGRQSHVVRQVGPEA